MHLQMLGGTPPNVLANHELMELVTSVLRADFMLHDSLSGLSGQLDCPILACKDAMTRACPTTTWRLGAV